MLIVIAGTIGVGKTTIAKALSTRLGISLYSIDEDKRAVYSKYPEHLNKIKEGIPMPDSIRKECFDASLENLRKLAKMQKHVIIEETFHQKKTREPFLNTAKKLFGGMVLILITASPEHIKERMRWRDDKEEHMANYKTAETFQRIFEPFDRVDYEIRNEGNKEKIIDTIITFLLRKI